MANSLNSCLPGRSGGALNRAACSLLLLTFLPLLVLLLTVRAAGSEGDLRREYTTDVWETADGLPQGTVTSLAQTRDGYLWLGTPNGLVRFDGNEFRVMDEWTVPAMRGRRVKALLPDANDGLWIGLENGGVVRMERGKFTAAGLPEDAVRCLARRRGGGIFIGTATGVVQWDGGVLTRVAEFPGTAAESLLETAGGVLWALADGRVRRPDGAAIGDGPDAGTRWKGMSPSYADNVWLFGPAQLLRVSSDGTAGTRQQVELEPGDAVTAICERSNGEVWLGTGHGVIRRMAGGPGTACRLFEGQPTCAILCLLEDAERNLWIGTEGGGLVRMKPKRVRNYGVADGLPGGRVTAFCADGRSSFWVGCGRDGLARWEAGKFTRFDAGGALPPNLAVTALLRTRDGSLWIGTDGAGVLRWKEGRLTEFGSVQGLTGQRIQAMVEMPDGSIFLGGSGAGLWQWSAAGFRHYGAEAGLEGTNISSLAVAPDGLWAGSNGQGLYRFQNGRGIRYTRADGLGSEFVRTLYPDSGNVLWIGTDAGVTRLEAGRLVHFGTEHGLWDNMISRIMDDGMLPANGGPNLWFGCNRGIFRVPRAAFAEAAAGRGVPLRPVIYGRAEGMECLECSGGFGPSGIIEHLTPNPGMENPRLWFPTLRGLVSLDGIPLVGRTDGIMGDHLVFYEARLHSGGGEVMDLGDVAAGGDGFGSGNSPGMDVTSGRLMEGWQNLITTDPATTVAERFHRTPLPFVDGVFVPNGGLSPERMVQISSTGLKVELPETNAGTWGFLKSGAGVPPREMFDPGDAEKLGRRFLWMPGNQGITFALEAIRRATGHSPARFSARVCNLHVGSASYHVFVDGRLMAWRSGLTRDFYRTLEENSIAVEVPLPPEAQFLTIVTTDNKDDPMGMNAQPPPVIIEEVREKGAARPADEGGLVTGPGSEGVEFRYTALSLVAAEKVRFRYRLEPLEPEWIEAGSRRAAHYPKLPPGDYRFEVIACNNDGVWNTAGAAQALTVLPHFWETWWFTPAWITLLCAAVVLGVIAALRARHRRRIVRLQQRHALEQERARIARDIHDDLGASLTNIALLSDLALSDLDQPQSARQHLDSIFNAAHRVARSVDEIVWAINPKNDAVERSLAYICKSAQDFLRPAGVLCRLEMPAEFPACYLTSSVRHNLYLAVREALHNAVKHSGAREVRLKVSVTAAALDVEIADNGCGFDPAAVRAAAHARHGLTNMRQRMAGAGGTFAITSRPGAGTDVRLSVPLQMDDTDGR